MGFHKFLDLWFIPECFRLVRNLQDSSCVRNDTWKLAGSAAPDATIKLVTLDGHVKTYIRPVPAAVLMAEFPKHLVCRSDAFYIGRKIPSLSKRDRLELGHNYFLLPNHFFQSVLTFVTVTSFVASRINGGRPAGKYQCVSPGKTVACQPFDVTRTPSGCLRIHVSDEFISHLVEKGKLSRDEEKGQRRRLCSTPQLEKDYVRMVEGSRSGRWKPKLETITEERKSRISSLSATKMRKDGDFRFMKSSSSTKTNSCENVIYVER